MKYSEFIKVTDWANYVPGAVESTPKTKKERGKYTYVDNAGVTQYTDSQSRLYTDDYWNVQRHLDISGRETIYTEGRSLKTASLLLGRIPNITQARISKFSNVYYVGDCPFREHTGAGHGGVKSFKKPSGKAMGIEIEMCFPDKDNTEGIRKKLNFSHWVRTHFPNWITERDGSLEDACRNSRSSNRPMNAYENHNLELVSPPLNPSELIRCLEEILPVAQEMGAEAKQVGDWYGIHITTNIYGQHTRKSASKLIHTVNLKKYRKFWNAVSNRPRSGVMKKYAPFFDSLTRETALDTMLGRGNHYMSAYPRSESGGAVEVRIFQSNIDINYISAIVELVSILTDYSIDKDEDTGEWLKYLKSKASDNLSEYLISSSAVITVSDE